MRSTALSPPAIIRTAVDESIVVRIQQHHAAAKKAARTSLEASYQCGLALLDAKQQIGHGGFAAFVERHCGFSARSARAYMQVAKNWERIAKAAVTAEMTIAEGLGLIAEPKGDSIPLADLRATWAAAHRAIGALLQACDGEQGGFREAVSQKLGFSDELTMQVLATNDPSDDDLALAESELAQIKSANPLVLSRQLLCHEFAQTLIAWTMLFSALGLEPPEIATELDVELSVIERLLAPPKFCRSADEFENCLAGDLERFAARYSECVREKFTQNRVWAAQFAKDWADNPRDEMLGRFGLIALEAATKRLDAFVHQTVIDSEKADTPRGDTPETSCTIYMCVSEDVRELAFSSDANPRPFPEIWRENREIVADVATGGETA